ncbi:MAG: hypothetical protein JST19_06620 [Bacteroidetes bacterium]|nr:hypothetical protein [Bacteroidota bacterium]
MLPKTFLFLPLTLLFFIPAYAQESKSIAYTNAFNEQLQMLDGLRPIDFKRAVFISEDAYYNNKLSYQGFCTNISNITAQLKIMIKIKGIGQYKTAGNWATFSFMTDTIPANSFKPFTYDFDDFTGSKDWSKMFVTKLLQTHSGNCHSLPYLYKILCDEIGAKSYLAFAPNHCYIKHINENGQWTNVELTNPSFPQDQEIIKQMYVTVEEIRQNIYMVPLTPKQNIACTMRDLAEGYKSKYGYDRFFLKMVSTALKYYPKSIPLIQHKANCLLSMIKAEEHKKNPDTQLLAADIAMHKQTIRIINELGYKDMPLELYKEWVNAVEKEKAKRGLTKTITN